MTPDPRRRLGAHGETLAAEHFTRRGYDVIERNFRTRSGELDLILSAPGCLVFCEVKTRLAGGGPDGPLDAIGPLKRRRVRRLAAEWLSSRAASANRPRADRLRFDAVGIVVARNGALVSLDHVEDAF